MKFLSRRRRATVLARYVTRQVNPSAAGAVLSS
jgi:hypothetical protein